MSYDYLKRLPDKGRRLPGIAPQHGARRTPTPRSIARPADPLRVASVAYFHKPAMVLFQSLALAAIRATGAKLGRPILDLGCGDGSFTRAVLQLAGPDQVDVGVDIDPRALARGNHRGVYAALQRADAERLPFAANTFNTTFSHCAVCCMHRDPALVLREVYRVTKPGGELLFTVATDHFNENYVLSHWLEWMGFSAAAASYRAAVDRRMSHVYCPSAAQWEQLTREAGFQVSDASGFAGDDVIRLYSVLIWTPLRVFALLRLLPLASVERGAAWLSRLAVRSAHRRARIRLDPGDSSYLLIRAGKR